MPQPKAMKLIKGKQIKIDLNNQTVEVNKWDTKKKARQKEGESKTEN